MKILLLVLVTVAQIGFSAELRPLITKSSGGGFMMPEAAGGETCQVFSDKVVITHFFGHSTPTALSLVEEKKITLSGNVQAVIEKTKAEELTSKPNGLCDGPATGIYVQPTSGEAVTLFSTGGCGSPRRSRDGMYSGKLKEIVNLYCPKTYDFGND